MRIFFLILSQVISLSFRKGGGAFGACAFYVIVVTLFTFAIGPEAMTKYAAAIMCVSTLLAIITTLPLLFERDHEDGTLEQLLLQPVLLELLVFAKICGQWCSHIIPILLVSPLLAIMAGFSLEQAIYAILILLLASPTMVALGAIGAALTIGSKRGGLLQALVVMPLYIPVLIFAAASGQDAGGQGGILFLTGMACVILPLSCYVCSALIKINAD
ncbi:MAG: heme exporter protein CcmB [Rickettsiales bacterium]